MSQVSQAFPKETPPLAAPRAFDLQPGPQFCLKLKSHLSCQRDMWPEPPCDGLHAPTSHQCPEPTLDIQ